MYHFLFVHLYLVLYVIVTKLAIPCMQIYELNLIYTEMEIESKANFDEYQVANQGVIHAQFEIGHRVWDS